MWRLFLNVLPSAWQPGAAFATAQLTVEEIQKARDASDRLVYDKSTGALYDGPDGTGYNAAMQFATLGKGLNVNHKDFIF